MPPTKMPEPTEDQKEKIGEYLLDNLRRLNNVQKSGISKEGFTAFITGMIIGIEACAVSEEGTKNGEKVDFETMTMSIVALRNKLIDIVEKIEPTRKHNEASDLFDEIVSKTNNTVH